MMHRRFLGVEARRLAQGAEHGVHNKSVHHLHLTFRWPLRASEECDPARACTHKRLMSAFGGKADITY
jgi:hypothetical protein